MVECELPGPGQAEKQGGPESRETIVPAEEKMAPAIERAGDLAEMFFERGIRYSTGKDVVPDLIAAHKWFNLAAQRGHAAARSYRNDLAHEMTPKEIAQAQREARAWIKREQETQRRQPAGARTSEAPAKDEAVSAAA
jgi:TPR repeat protein